MKNYFDADGTLKFERFFFLNGRYRAILNGYGTDDWGYTYDIEDKGHEYLGVIHNKRGFKKERTFTRKLSAKQWLTNFYRDHNEQ